MFLPGWFIWWVLVTATTFTRGLEISGHDSDEVICSQGFSECTMKDEIPFLPDTDGVDVVNLTAYFKLCSKGNESCSLCLVIDTDLHIHLDDNTEYEGHSGLDEEEDSEVMENLKASVTVCYNTPSTMPSCKKVEFTVNHTALTQHNQAKVSVVITEPSGVSFSSKVFVYPHKLLHLKQEVVTPSLDKVCSQELNKCVNECRVPEINVSIHKEMNYVELLFDRSNNSLPSVCIQYEKNGTCQSLMRRTIPLYSVTHCMCIQAWYDQNYVRSRNCPFRNMDISQRNVWENLSVLVDHRHSNKFGSMLLWNISAPCRLKGEVWPCHKENSCKEMKGFRQQLADGRWRQNGKGLWEKTGVFEAIDLQLSPCVMVKINGMGHEQGPFCYNNTDRCRWSLLVIGVLLLVSLTVLAFYLLHDFVKRDKQPYLLDQTGQMGDRMLHGILLQAAWLCCLLAVQVHSCPGTCNTCSGPESDQCEECKAGWTLHNNTCVDIDECGTKLGNCPPNTFCFNTEGSFECRDCDLACVGCMGSGKARCRKCASGYRLTGSKCLDIDECSDRVLACPGLDEICTNTKGSFRCDCAKGFIRKDSVCVKKQLPSGEEKSLFEDIQDDEVEVLQQMFFGVVLCALATLAAKGDLVYTSVFMGAVAAMAGYWLSDRGDRLLHGFIKGH